jgi:N-acetylglucosaminyldiphosphoundecaprenol N-acetyl-beta-D-mannosaminyltransferase
MRKIVSILGIPVDDLNTVEVLDRLEQFITSRRFHQVATANVDFLIKANADPELKCILRTADLVVPDGMPLVWASRWMHNGLRERVTGADLVSPLAERAAANGYRIFMLGGEPQVAQAAKARLESLYPAVTIVGCESPDVPNLVTADCEPILRRIEEAKPDILLVAFGNPKQEKFIHMHRDRLNVPVCIGVGGTFDFIAGKTKRAPRVMQKLGLEFLHRWAGNPKRLGARYKQNITQFPPLIIRQVRAIDRSRDAEPVEVSVTEERDCAILSLSGTLTGRYLDSLMEPVESAFAASRHVVLDMTAVRGADGYSLGALQNLWKRAAWAKCEVRFVNPPQRFRRALEVTDSLNLFRQFSSRAEAVAAAPVVQFSACLSAEGEGATVAVCGSASVAHLDKLESVLEKASQCGQVVCLDLREVSYIDCAGLYALWRFADNRKQRGLVTTCAPSTPVVQALAREKLKSIT